VVWRPESAPDSRGVSETLGLAVLVGMTVFVTAALGVGVMLTAEQEQKPTAEIDFNYLSNRLAIVYEDDQPRQADRLFIEGPDNNVSWAELDEAAAPADMIDGGTAVFAGPDTAYGASVGENDRIEVVFITDEGERVVLATWNESQDPLDDGAGGGGGPDDGDPGQQPGG